MRSEGGGWGPCILNLFYALLFFCVLTETSSASDPDYWVQSTRIKKSSARVDTSTNWGTAEIRGIKVRFPKSE